jgi:hypothetical protein
MTTKTIEKILRAGSLPGGHAVVIDLQIEGGEAMRLECSIENLPLLAVAVHDAGVGAERARNAQPGKPLSAMVLHQATAVRTGVTGDRCVVLSFQTDAGKPSEVVIAPELTRATIERLQSALDQIGRTPPTVRS